MMAQPSVIQQRGNVIVSRRSQVVTSDNNGGFHHNSSIKIDREKNECYEYTSSNPVEQLVSRYQNFVDVDGGNSDNQDQEQNLINSVQSKKTDQNGNNSDNGRKTGTKKGTQSFSCPHCQKIFQHKSYYDYHLRTHSGERPFQCSMCTKSFFERSKLNRHLSSCHNVKSNDYYIVADDDGISNKSNQCTKCHKTFSRSSGLQTHMLSHHEGIRPFTCTQCKKAFSGLTALKNHEKSHQSVKNILCQICGKAFLLQKYLDLHLKTTHKQEARKHRCGMCRKAFHSEKDLRRHQATHSNLKQFACTICQTSFKRKDNLNRHLKLTHLMTPEEQNEESGNSSEMPEKQQAIQSQAPMAMTTLAPPINQVSVIKSTHEVMMSISRGQHLL